MGNYKKEYLKQLLIDYALVFNNIQLSSGKHSNYYIDARMVTTLPEGAQIVAEIMKNIIGETDAVGGPELGAVPILGALAGLGYYQTFIIRKQAKKYGLNKWIEGHLGEEIAIIDDVATTGNSLLKAICTVKKCFPEIKITKVVVLVDREEGAKEALMKRGYELVSIFKANELFKKEG